MQLTKETRPLFFGSRSNWWVYSDLLKKIIHNLKKIKIQDLFYKKLTYQNNYKSSHQILSITFILKIKPCKLTVKAVWSHSDS
jgi:hypothetical protein